MPVRIADEWVASRDDFRGLDNRINELSRNLSDAQSEARKQAQENQQRIRTVETTITQQISRIDKLTTNLTNLDQAFQQAVNTIEQTLDTITAELSKTGDYLVEMNTYLQSGADRLEQISASVRDQAQTETSQRKVLTGSLTQYREQQSVLAAALQDAFHQVHKQLTTLVEIEKDGAQLVDESLSQVRAVLVNLQDQTQHDLGRLADEIDQASQARQQRSDVENQSLAQLVHQQEQLNACLALVQAASAQLVTTVGQLENSQHAAVDKARQLQAQEMNLMAAGLVERGEYKAAQSVLEQAVGYVPDDPALMTNLAVALMKNGQLSRAEELLTRVVQIAPQFSAALNQYGLLYLAKQQPELAIPWLRQAADQAADQAAIWLNLGKAEYELGNIAFAIQAFRKAQQLEPALVVDDTLARLVLEDARLGQ